MRSCRPTDACPCGRRTGAAVRRFGDCCGPFLDGGQAAPDAESLMRSRYSAFVLEREAYLLATWHPTQRPADIAFEPDVKWLGLEVRDARQHSATQAEVEFVARQKPARAPAVRLHERSRFVREDGRWLYLDALP